MDAVAITFAGRALGPSETGLALLCAALALIAAAALLAACRAGAAAARARDTEARVSEMQALQAELTGRMRTMAEVFGSRQGEFARMLAERIDTGAHRQAETLTRLNERLAVIDAAQRRLSELAAEVASLGDILGDKQARGAYGQGRIEAIVRDGLPAGAFAFQATLSNRSRPDCVIRLPGDPRGLVIDAKFPLEGFLAFREAKGEARARAAARVRTDVGAHVKAIAEKYLIPGETQDVALMFVPAESLHADIQEHFPDLVQRAHRARVILASPSLLALAIQMLQTLSRDARMREEARLIQGEVARLVADVARLDERAERLEQHFRQAEGDLAALRVSAGRIARRGQRIETLDLAGATEEENPRPAAAE